MGAFPAPEHGPKSLVKRTPQDTLPIPLTVSSADPYVRIVLLDPDRQELSGFGQVSLKEPRIGIHRARLVLPDGTFQERSLEVHEEGPSHFSLHAPPPALGEVQRGMLQMLGMTMDAQGYMSPSEALGPIAGLPLASLLGFAAFAASPGSPPGRADEKLKRLGIRPPDGPPGSSGLLVLLGASGNEPVPGMSVPDFLADSRLVLHSARTGQRVWEGSFQELPGFGAAAQWGQTVSPGSWMLELALPSLKPTRYALVALPDHVSILVVAADDSGEVEVQQYLVPLPGRVDHQSIEPASAVLGNLRHVELAQRYLALGMKIPQQHLRALLTGQLLDPILCCATGYALVRQGQQERFGGTGPKEAPGKREQSALRNMLHRFDELPDTHVLAGFCEPWNQEVHFNRALERGLPLFSDGLRALQHHASSTTNRWVAEASRELLPASMWTAWIVR